jgi:hypothetical protein
MTKQEVMQVLLSVEANVPSEVITYVGANLKDTDCKPVVFNHENENMFDACGVSHSDLIDMHKAVVKFMMDLPDDCGQRSRGVEFIISANNPKWNVLCAIAGFDKINEHFQEFMGMKKDKDDLVSLIHDALKARMRKGRTDEE